MAPGCNLSRPSLFLAVTPWAHGRNLRELSTRHAKAWISESGQYSTDSDDDCFASSAQLTGTLTLTAQGNPNAQWIFQIGSTLTTAKNSTVDLDLGGKGGRGCNVYWQVGSSATVGKGSFFVGKIMALTSITLNGGVLRGKALARKAAITISSQETVDGPRCVSAGAADGDGMDSSQN